MAFKDRDKNPKGLRVIKTARDKHSINTAAKNGFRPLLKKVEPSDKIHSKYSVFQHKQTGEISVIHDFRDYFYSENPDFERVIDWTSYYPYHFKSPYAAYLIPEDIAVGERVFLEDLIEDYVGTSWNQGDESRLESCEAIWDGSDLIIQYDPRANRRIIVG